MLILDNHRVTIRTNLNFDLVLCFGRARPRGRHEVHEREFLRITQQTRDPQRIKRILEERDDDDPLFD